MTLNMIKIPMMIANIPIAVRMHIAYFVMFAQH